MGVELIFCLQINIKDDSITLGVCSQACPKYPKHNFSISLQYVKENVNNEVDFLAADKH